MSYRDPPGPPGLKSSPGAANRRQRSEWPASPSLNATYSYQGENSIIQGAQMYAKFLLAAEILVSYLIKHAGCLLSMEPPKEFDAHGCYLIKFR